MESITVPSDPDAEAVIKPTRGPDRMTLGPTEARKVDQWLSQIHESSKGFLSLSRSELVNFLIREHRGELLPSELKRVRSDHYDPIKHIQWIMPQIKDAWNRSDSVRVAELQEELRGVEISVVRTPDVVAHGLAAIRSEPVLEQPKKRGRKSKAKMEDSLGPYVDKNTDRIADNETLSSAKEPLRC